jgi:uncharacterized membrane protein
MASFRVALRSRLFPFTIASAMAICPIWVAHVVRGTEAESSTSHVALSTPGQRSPQRAGGTSKDVRRRKILYMEGAPRFEWKFIQRSRDGMADPQVVILQRTADRKYLRLNVDGPDELRDGFPRTSEELFAYRGLILGPIEASAFTPEQHQMIADFVGVRGGGLLVLGGEQSFGEGGWSNTPLAHVAPVIIAATENGRPAVAEQLRGRPTAEGLNHAATQIADSTSEAIRLWQELPDVTSVNRVDTKPDAVTLLAGTDTSGREQVVLAVQTQRRGKAAAFMIQDSWRWAVTRKVDSPVHEKFWRSLLAWLVDGVPD